MEKHYFNQILEGDYSQAEILEAFEKYYPNITAEDCTPETRRLISHPKIADPLKLIGLRKLDEATQDELYADFQFLMECQKSTNREILNLSEKLINKLDLPEYLKDKSEAYNALRFLKGFQYSENRNISNLSMELVLNIIAKNRLATEAVGIYYLIDCQNSDNLNIKNSARTIVLSINFKDIINYLRDTIDCVKTKDPKGASRSYFQKGGPDAIRLAENLLFTVNPSDFWNQLEYLIKCQEDPCPNVRSITEKLALRLPTDLLATKLFDLLEYQKSGSANVRILARELVLLIPSEELCGTKFTGLLKLIRHSDCQYKVELARKVVLKVDPKILVKNNELLDSNLEQVNPKLKSLTTELLALIKKEIVRPEKVEELQQIVASY